MFSVQEPVLSCCQQWPTIPLSCSIAFLCFFKFSHFSDT